MCGDRAEESRGQLPRRLRRNTNQLQVNLATQCASQAKQTAAEQKQAAWFGCADGARSDGDSGEGDVVSGACKVSRHCRSRESDAYLGPTSVSKKAVTIGSVDGQGQAGHHVARAVRTIINIDRTAVVGSGIVEGETGGKAAGHVHDIARSAQEDHGRRPAERLILDIAAGAVWKCQTVSSPDHAEVRAWAAAESGEAAIVVIFNGLKIPHAHKVHCGARKRAGCADCKENDK